MKRRPRACRKNRPSALGWALAAMLLAALTLTAPESTLGSGHWAIQVTGNEAEIHFPEEIAFSLVAESSADIVEVRLDYRNTLGGFPAYTYATFTPGPRVKATVEVPTGGGNYLAPGTQVEYYFSIKDARGRQRQTEPRVLEYTDNRFQWQRTQAGPLTLLHHGVAQHQVDAAARSLEADLERIMGLLGLRSDPPPIRGFIYNDFDEAAAAFPYQSETLTREQVFHGFAFPATGSFLGIGLQPQLLTHEAAHLLLGQAVGPNGAVPRWLDEGFASYVEPGSQPYSGTTLSPHSVPLRRMSGLSGTPQEIDIFYAKAESVVAYLVEGHGSAAFQRFIQQLGQGRTSDEALVRVYGFDTDGLDTRWAASSQGLALPSSGRPQAGPPSPLLFLDVWLLGGLILVVMLAVFLKFLWGKLFPREEEEEEDYW